MKKVFKRIFNLNILINYKNFNQVKIWFQNHRYKTKKSQKDKEKVEYKQNTILQHTPLQYVKSKHTKSTTSNTNSPKKVVVPVLVKNGKSCNGTLNNKNDINKNNTLNTDVLKMYTKREHSDNNESSYFPSKTNHKPALSPMLQPKHASSFGDSSSYDSANEEEDNYSIAKKMTNNKNEETTIKLKYNESHECFNDCYKSKVIPFNNYSTTLAHVQENNQQQQNTERPNSPFSPTMTFPPSNFHFFSFNKQPQFNTFQPYFSNNYANNNIVNNNSNNIANNNTNNFFTFNYKPSYHYPPTSQVYPPPLSLPRNSLPPPPPSSSSLMPSYDPFIIYPHNTLPHNSLPHNTLTHNTLPHNTLPHNTPSDSHAIADFGTKSCFFNAKSW